MVHVIILEHIHNPVDQFHAIELFLSIFRDQSIHSYNKSLCVEFLVLAFSLKFQDSFSFSSFSQGLVNIPKFLDISKLGCILNMIS